MFEVVDFLAELIQQIKVELIQGHSVKGREEWTSEKCR